MLAITRKGRIRDIISEKKSATVSELAVKFDVTEETIRRDLKFLGDEGFLQRTYGGAYILEGVQNEIALPIRENAYADSKIAIAKHCKNLIKNGDSIFLGSSTTALFVAERIKNLRITVITNSLKITNIFLGLSNIRLVTIGGMLDNTTMSFLGANSVKCLEQYYMDKAFVSCRHLCTVHGLTDVSEQTAAIRRLAMSHANEVFLIADHSKLNKTSFVKISDFSPVTSFVTDKNLDSDWTNFLKDKNIAIYD